MTTPEEFFAGNEVGLDTYARVAAELLRTHPDVSVRVSRSQVAFRCRRGFAYVWMPGRYLAHPSTEVVLSVVL